MTNTEVLSIVFSTISVLVAAFATFAAYKTYTLAKLQLRLDKVNEFQKALLDMNKELLRDPSLWAIYEDSIPSDSLLRQKLEAFAYIKINLAEMVYTFFHGPVELAEYEEQVWKVWHRLFQHEKNSCVLLREIINAEEAEDLYSASFLQYVRDL